MGDEFNPERLRKLHDDSLNRLLILSDVLHATNRVQFAAYIATEVQILRGVCDALLPSTDHQGLDGAAPKGGNG